MSSRLARLRRRAGFLERLRNYWAIYSESKVHVVALILFIAEVILATLAPYLPLPDPHALKYPMFLPPSTKHPFGTDSMGRDIFSRVIWGARTSLEVGVIAAGISALVGILIGAIAGYYGGLMDDVLSRITDIFLMIPAFFLILYVAAVYGASIYCIMAIIGLTIWPSNARIMRAQVLSLKEREFIQAEVLMGASNFRILFHHIIPNAIQPVLANTILQMARAIIIEASLSYIGVGDPNVISWGRMIYEGQAFLATYPWVPLFPGLAIAYTVFLVNVIGDGLSKVLAPKIGRRLV